ncbi:hypothetical protein [Pseudomonas yamanorum]|uniref:Lipoprotein n=1 Tax=Pseudomonas yamanorum TaxID=515393 RepID=A0AAJ3H8H6_9PSED|nr:hypothetical protein [Pseudomonas yamanorum]NWD44459.1 hypothetical protein [Pseudomonas yamanorum]
MKVWCTVASLILLAGCQTQDPHSSYPLTEKQLAQKQLTEDMSVIEPFTNAHPWIGEEVESPDSDEWLIAIERFKKMGPAYLAQRDQQYQLEQQHKMLKVQGEAQKIEDYRNAVASKKRKTYAGSFMKAYFRLLEASRYQRPISELSMSSAGMYSGVFDLDAPFMINNCDTSYCTATAVIPPENFALHISVLIPRRLHAGDAIPPSLIEVFGIDQHGDFVVNVLGPNTP